MKCNECENPNTIYRDGLKNCELCFVCVDRWLKDKNNRMKQREEPPIIRWTVKSPSGCTISVGNFNSGLEKYQEFDKIINVSDSMNKNATHWFPINEVAPWTYSPFFWFKRIVENDWIYEKTKILVHCHAGIHRSAMMVYTFLLSVGYNPFQIDSITYRNLTTDYEFDIEKGIIPGDLKRFYSLMTVNKTWSLMGILREMGTTQLLCNQMIPRKMEDFNL